MVDHVDILSIKLCTATLLLSLAMKPYSTFIFDSYDWQPDTGVLELRYSLDDELHFVEKLIFPIDSQPVTRNPHLDAAFFALHLIGGISYYKTCLPKSIEVRSGSLNESQAQFWNSVYENGLGEFFYKNQIDFRGLINFQCHTERSEVRHPDTMLRSAQHDKNRALIPVGGGKDSVVTIEQLKKAGKSCTLFRLGHHALITHIAEIAGLPLLNVERHLSTALFELNAQGALNGHIPITAYLSFVTIVASLLYGFDAVAMSNEKSANEGNVEFHGKMINHQWSKSEEFAAMFRQYVHDYITPEVNYQNPLAQMTELAIVGEFAKYPQYFACTTSCNTNWKLLVQKNPDAATLPRAQRGAWCCTCPKCAFVFALYAAHLPKKTVLEIFGKNLFDDASLQPLYKELLGLQGFKPFECVGTPEETKEAFRMAHAKKEWDDTAMMKVFLKAL